MNKQKSVWIVGPVALVLGLLIGTQGDRLFGTGSNDSGMASPGMDDDAPVYQSGPYKVSVAVNPEAPTVGDNKLMIKVMDAQGNPLEDARIEAFGQMPAMGAMAAMRAPANLEQVAPGQYAGSMNLEMSGEWPLSVKVEKADMGSTALSFDMATGRAGLQLTSGGTKVRTAAGGRAAAANQNGMQSAQPEEVPANAIMVDSRRRQLIGVETDEVAYRALTRTIRAIGQVAYDETKLSDVTLRFDAWIGELEANYVGKDVRRGDVLFTVYGPELLAAQQQYLEVLKGRFGQSNGLIEAARKRLLLWDMAPNQIEQLEQRGEPLDYVPIMAPLSGTVVGKHVVIGSANMAGTRLMRIADLSQVWVEAEVYEAELPLVEKGMPAVVTLPYLPGKTYEAKVDYVYPYLQGMTRTGRIRLTLNNPDGVLKPDMYAEVNLKADLGRRLVVPEEAVLFAGESRVVFVDLGGGNLKPQKIETGQRAGNYIEVLEGLEAGDEVVTSGNFLIASEARLKTGVEQW